MIQMRNMIMTKKLNEQLCPGSHEYIERSALSCTNQIACNHIYGGFAFELKR